MSTVLVAVAGVVVLLVIAVVIGMSADSEAQRRVRRQTAEERRRLGAVRSQLAVERRRIAKERRRLQAERRRLEEFAAHHCRDCPLRRGH